MHITILGAGYVGLVSAACFAEYGVEAVCVESNPSHLDDLRAQRIPFYEPDLADLVARNVQAGRLQFSAEAAPAVHDSDIVFIAVGTPRRADGSELDISQVRAATSTIAQHLSKDRRTLIVTRSTVPVGTAELIEGLIREIRPELTPNEDFDVAANPEFLREGSAIEDFQRPDRVVLGTVSTFARERLEELYQPLGLPDGHVLHTDRTTAELIKYVTNAYLATKLTFINEVANLCERNGANITDLATALGLDARIGPQFLHPGPGFGGSCLPKDALALVSDAAKHGVEMRTVRAVIDANQALRANVAKRVLAAVGGELANRTVAVLGLSFKPDTDDMREAVSRETIPELTRQGAKVRAYDPEAMPKAQRDPEFAGVEFCETAWDAVDGADALLVLTEWREFRGMSPNRLREALRRPVVVDMRNIFDAQAMEQAGIEYFGVGRKRQSS